MSNSMVENQTQQVSVFLQEVITLMTDYVNYHTLPSLLEESPEGNRDYYEGLLSSLRRLLVFCEEGLDACLVLLSSQPFRKKLPRQHYIRFIIKLLLNFFTKK